MSEDFRLQINYKLGNGSLINVRTANPAELTDLLAVVRESVQDIADTYRLLEAGGVVAQAGLTTPAPAQDAPAWASRATDPAHQPPGVPIVGPSGQWVGNRPPEQYQQPQAQPQQGGTPSCPHGQQTWREGVGKASGKPYKGWFCGAGVKGCEPTFVR